jgi:hypothetical protein
MSLSPLNSDVHISPLNSDIHISPLNSDVHISPLNSDVHISPLNSDVHILPLVILTKKSGKFQISRTFNPILKRYQMRSSFNVVFSLKNIVQYYLLINKNKFKLTY